ncbi:MAG TPA: transcriptional regulator, partial [Treponemataceae bacterium]|nr:transcriptional regulator [Treponemataceae bacterium]
ILVHKYFINSTVETEIPFSDALVSWYRNVYLPVMQVIKKYRLNRKFRRRTSSDLYVWIIKQWDDLKRKYGLDYSLDRATLDWTKRERPGIVATLRAWLKRGPKT